MTVDLASLQRDLAASLARGAASPAGVDGQAVDRLRRGLVSKRGRAAAGLLPRLVRALGATRLAPRSFVLRLPGRAGRTLRLPLPGLLL